jgi:hypothetical protein
VGPKEKSSPAAGMMNDDDILHYQCEYAASGRFSCKDFKCKAKIAKGRTLISYQYYLTLIMIEILTEKNKSGELRISFGGLSYHPGW